MTMNEKSNEVTLFNQNNKYDPGILENIGRDKDMISLTDLWKAAGSIREKAPNFWINQDSTSQLVDTVQSMLNATKNCIIKSKRGKGGGTYANRQIALAYAKYLDPRASCSRERGIFSTVGRRKEPRPYS